MCQVTGRKKYGWSLESWTSAAEKFGLTAGCMAEYTPKKAAVDLVFKHLNFVQQRDTVLKTRLKLQPRWRLFEAELPAGALSSALTPAR
ncbi:hypothetical protein EYF80_019323 [Liparis tanakae]|uniref:Uncharacterized protein n=1 Tax=Liparis tanakae TaxID=230148 RepID=A0A4Z2HX60_9TELE|nr:hypothetical protein EYF80_019323 [Liparis tanakae]